MAEDLAERLVELVRLDLHFNKQGPIISVLEH